MQRLFLSGFISFILSGVACAETLRPADMSAVEVALVNDDPRGLVDALSGKIFDLSVQQNQEASQLLLDYLPTVAAEDRKTVGNLLTLLIQKQAGADEKHANITSESPPPEIRKALDDQDGARAVRLILAEGFDIGAVGLHKDALIKLVSDYAKPIPAVNAQANKEAYQALAVLDPDNDTYKKKAVFYEQSEEKQRAGAVAKLRKRTDEFSGVTFYTHPSEPRYADSRSYFIPYLVVKSGSIVMRIELHYTADSWLFIRKAAFNVDGEMISFDVPGSAWKRDNDSEIWEWADVPVDSNLRKLLEKVANSKKTIVRLDGQQYYDDFTISEKDKAAIREVFAAEDILKEKG